MFHTWGACVCACRHVPGPHAFVEACGRFSFLVFATVPRDKWPIGALKRSRCWSRRKTWREALSRSPLLQGLGVRFPPTTGSRVLALVKEQERKTCQAAYPANSAKKKSLSTVAAPLPCLNVRCGDGGCNCMCVLALLRLAEV